MRKNVYAYHYSLCVIIFSMNKVSFITLGCRLNQAEEEKLRRKFSEVGVFVVDVSKSELVIVNTCSVTQLADKKSRQKIRSIIKKKPNAKIVVMGCGSEETKDINGVDLFIPNQEKENAFKLITKKYKIHIYSHVRKNEEIFVNKNRTRALLKVQDGCNNFCTYCIVPYLRGREVSVPISRVISEAKKLDNLGYKELVISGVNVGKYNYELEGNKISLEKLIKEILGKTKFPRIRLSSINPQDITPELIDLWAHEDRLCNHYHLSLQSGSTSVLKRMKRAYTAEKYAEVVQIIREKMPDVAITTDIIVGFPGESESEFMETCDFVKSIKFAKLHVFPYSVRKGTRAADMKDQVDNAIKKTRAEKLRKIGQQLQSDYHSQFIGGQIPVLFEEEKSGYWFGLTSNYIRVKHKSKEDLENQILSVKLTKTKNCII